MGEPAQDIFSGRHLVVGVSGGIAAYKTAAMVSTLVQRGATVRVVMTDAAKRFIGPVTFQALTRQPVYSDMWADTEDYRSTHISLADWADACVIAPATANVLSKMACGLADDLLSTTVLTLDVPVLLAPAMNMRMWAKQVVQDNVARLRDLGYTFVGPAEGRLACGTTGPGRMSEPEEIIAALQTLLAESNPTRIA
jgi:phosphopantothenoylcysteine decarboxylase/phosphopantothenate--cysteine ligase